MYNHIEELKSEISQFEENISWSNGILNTLGEIIEKLNANYDSLHNTSNAISNVTESYASLESRLGEKTKELSDSIEILTDITLDSDSKIETSVASLMTAINILSKELHSIKTSVASLMTAINILSKELHSIKKYVIIGMIFAIAAAIFQLL